MKIRQKFLTFGAFEGIPKKYIKSNIKILGCFFGENEIKVNFQSKIIKMEKMAENWKFIRFNLIDKTISIKTYMTSLLQFQLQTFMIPKKYLKQINKIIFSYLWCYRREKIARKLLIRNIDKGGLAFPDIKTKNITNFIKHVQNMQDNLKQPWACLFIYWFGIYLKTVYKDYASKKWVHNLHIPKKLLYIKEIILEHREDDKIWKLRSSLLYKYLIDRYNTISKIENIYRYINWDIVWKAILSFPKNSDKTILYRYIFSVQPTGEYFVRYGIVAQIPICAMCKTHKYTETHIFQQCKNYMPLRKNLFKKIKQLDPKTDINYTLIKFGNNKKNTENIDLQKAISIFKYVLDVWRTTEKQNINV